MSELRTFAHDPDPDALNTWRGGVPAGPQSCAALYLRNRGNTRPVPPSIRSGARTHLGRYDMPMMIAAVQAPAGHVIAVQTTLLRPDGRKAPVAVPRITTGALGLGAVRLSKATDVLGLAEGTETALSAMQLFDVPCWAALGAARMARVQIPEDVRELHIFADADDPGRAAAEATAKAHRHRQVVIHVPPDGLKDFNDVLTSRRAAA